MATLALLKRDFEFGLITGARVFRFFGSDLVVEFRYRDRPETESLVDARTKKPRCFKTYDAAFRAIEAVGLQVGAVVVEPARSGA